MKDYSILDELIPKTQELHRAIFDKGYEQGRKDALEQQPCDDCISRQKAINCVTSNEFRYKIVEDIKKFPSVTPKGKSGHWVNAKVGKLFPSNDFKCSECGNILDFDGVNCGRGDANYCPNCGARMFEPQESEYKEGK